MGSVSPLRVKTKMERYGGAGEDESRSDPSLEWTATGNETGIEGITLFPAFFLLSLSVNV